METLKRFSGDPVKVLTGVSITIGIVVGVWQIWDRLFPDPGPPRLSVQYIVDVSETMTGTIGRRPKLDAVREEVLVDVRSTPNAAAALRLTGGGCSSGYVPPHVGFGQDNAGDFEGALADVRAGGQSDFAQAIRHAANDLLGREREAGGRSKTLVVVIGGMDTCTADPGPAINRALRSLRAEESLELNFKFVGVKAPRNVRRLLRSVRGEARRLDFVAETEFPTTPAELADAIDAGGAGPADDQYGETE